MGCICSSEKNELEKCTKENTPVLDFKGQEKYMKVIDVYDGDTITVALIFEKKPYQVKLRLKGIDTPEIRTKDQEEKKKGIEARDFLRRKILGKTVYVHCDKQDKYGRLLGDIYLYRYHRTTVNQTMIDKGYAVPYFGGKKK